MQTTPSHDSHLPIDVHIYQKNDKKKLVRSLLVELSAEVFEICQSFDRESCTNSGVAARIVQA